MKIIRIITNTKSGDSCREVFKNMEIMTLYSQYMYSFILYIVNNKYLFNTNNEIHKYRTRYNNNLHLPIVTYQNSIKELIYRVLKSSATFLNISKLWLMMRNVLNPH